MTTTPQVMTDGQRKSVVLTYFRGIDTRSDISGLFSEDIALYAPKMGIVQGQSNVLQAAINFVGLFRSIQHHTENFRYIMQGETVVVEGTTSGVAADGTEWRAGLTPAGIGYFCNVFEIRDFKIQRLAVYLDPDYAGADTARYPWLNLK